MIFKKKIVSSVALALLAATLFFVHPGAGASEPESRKDKPASGETQPRKLSPAESALVDKAIFSEKGIIQVLRDKTPLVETYIQSMRPDPELGQVPDSDQHFLGRVEFSSIIDGSQYQINKAITKGAVPSTADRLNSMLGFLKSPMSYFSPHGSDLRTNFRDNGFIQMLLIDSNDFDRDHYVFSYVRSEFLGNTPAAVFDVSPLDAKHNIGRFLGRIWIETRKGNIVRFNGEFTGSQKGVSEYFHFDSWRTNVQPGLWLPTSFYVEESEEQGFTHTLRFKAIGHIWGYALKSAPKEEENTSMDVVGATDVSNDATDVSPRAAQRAWAQQAEDNVITRLFQAGLLDAPSEFDKTLEALANNILVYNHITLIRPIRCRILLTEPLESFAIGNTIILSKGLLDTTGVISQDGMQQMGNLNAVLAFQLAHIILGHRTDTQFAFSDRMLFPSNMVFNRIPMHHSDADNASATKKAVELLSAKELEDGPQYFGLYLQQLGQRIKNLPALTEPLIGDGLSKSDTDQTFWMADLLAKGPKLDISDLKQEAAMPLSNFLRIDPWSDQIIVLHTGYDPLLTPADKMPFEVTPVYLKLGYYNLQTTTDASPANGATTDSATDSSAPASSERGPTDSQNQESPRNY
ncbi:MAG: hypothetical protein FWD64_01095 [Acidobacteriaceae bacterium]|nr:hypothetical protein [Acidobacteriaceae bacterium]